MGVSVHINRLADADVSKVIQNYAEDIASSVEEAAEDLYMIDNYADTGNAKFREWYDAADLFLKTGSIDSFIYARYGYAVEEYVNSKISSQKIQPPRGYKVRLQVTHGGTRPDIVVMTEDNKELAWMDITSSNSKGHILNKAGDWENAACYIAELLYPDLDLSKICRDREGSIASNRAPRILRAAALMNRRYMAHMRACLDLVLRKAHSEGACQESHFARLIEEYFKIDLPGHYKHPIIHSMLKMYIDDPCCMRKEDAMEWIGKYRHGGVSQDKSAAMSYITDSYNYEEKYIELFDDASESSDSDDEDFDPEEFFGSEFVFR